MSKRRGNEVTIKERKFVKALIETGSKKKAALKAYDTKSDLSASHMAKQILNRPAVQEYIKQALDRKGLSLEDITDKLYSSIDKNMREGKGSQAVAADLIKFTYKLQDAVPINKTVSTRVNLQGQIAGDNMLDLKKTLENLTATTTSLLQELKK